jgi:hypothetical protein
MATFLGAISSGDGRITKISKLKKGDIFRKVGGKSELVYDGKVRSYSKWGDYKGYAFSWHHYFDSNRLGETRQDINVEVDFTF